jgi:chromosomal replication initiation ATPase DnaA
MGSKDFIKEISKKFLNEKFSEVDIPDHKEIKKTFIPSVDQVITAVAAYYKVDRYHVKIACRGKSNNMKSIAIYLAITYCHVSLKKIALTFGDSTRNGIANNYQRFLLRVGSEKYLKDDINNIENLLAIKGQGST